MLKTIPGNFFLLFLLVTPFLTIELAWCRPQKLEVWFLSPPYEQSHVFNFFKFFSPLEKWKNSSMKMVSDNSAHFHRHCQLMGDQFFHPQFGVHDHQFHPLQRETPYPRMEQEGLVGVESIAFKPGWESNLIQCDNNNYFDLYCGEGKNEKGRPVSLEVWVDISSSLLHVDQVQNKKECYRKSFVNRLKNKCGKNNLGIKLFNTSIKEVTSDESLCDMIGLNDVKKLIKWIESSQAKKLIIITDIFEFGMEFSDYLHKMSAQIYGDHPKLKLFGKDLLSKVDGLSKSCEKSP